MKAMWAIGFLILAICLSGFWFSSSTNGIYPEESGDLPGIYEVATNGELDLSVIDMHRYEAEPGSWILTIGLVIQNNNNKTLQLEPMSFKVKDDSRRLYSPLPRGEFPLKNPLVSEEIFPRSQAVGSLAFKLNQRAKPLHLINEETATAISLIKEVVPPGIIYPLGEPVKLGRSIIGIEGVARSKDGRKLRVDYLLKNIEPGAISLKDRAYGRFGDLIDSHGMSYSAYEYKMLGPLLLPDSLVEGNMTYLLPEGSDPRYLLFWPPDEDAILFDLKKVE